MQLGRPVGMRLVMNNRGRNRRKLRGGRWLKGIAAVRAAIACAGAVLLVAGCVAGCSTFVEGRALSMLNDPFRVGGLPATDGPSGPRPNGPAPTGTVVNTDNGPIDKLSLLSVNDIEEYWQGVYSESLKGNIRASRQAGFLRLQRPQWPGCLPQQHVQARQRLFHKPVQPDRLGSRGVHAGRTKAISATWPSMVC